MALLGLLCVLAVLGACGAAPKPHILFILADDYGWANIGYHNNDTEIETPNLNKLNAQGIELDRHYAFMYCSPSRCAVLTGRNPIHVNTYNKLDLNYNPQNNITGYGGVPLNMTMIASKLKDGGYATHFTGKWDAGFATNYHLPISRGFDSGFGYFTHTNDHWQYTAACHLYDIWNNTEPAYTDINAKNCSQNIQTGCAYEDDQFLTDVLQKIDAHDPTQPLFYYWAMHAVHAPLEVPQSYFNKFKNIDDRQRRMYAAMVNHMDDMVGAVIAKIQEKGMWENTLVVFAADNGGPLYGGGGGNNYPLKGGKMSNWEGGIRVNAFVSGGFVPEEKQGTKSEDLIALWDWYSTFCYLAGVDPTDYVAEQAGLPAIDSINMWPLLAGWNDTNPRTELPIGNNAGGTGNMTTVQGIIVPPYKLLLNNLTQSFWQSQVYPNITTNYTAQNMLFTDCGDTGCLFNIMTDPGEHNDISAEFPDIAVSLLKRIAYYQTTVFNADRGPSTGACLASKKKYHGFLGPWVDPIF